MQSQPEVMNRLHRIHQPPDTLYKTLCLGAFFSGERSNELLDFNRDFFKHIKNHLSMMSSFSANDYLRNIFEH